ncbi:hypothetical protein ACFVTX_18065 [Agromyces sp. NPDC058136]|uniref:hypothetical protein n=1 Tax=Agromyces sp. NPDC058136 TaxID=3346354 RepID=UPI0036DAFDBA
MAIQHLENAAMEPLHPAAKLVLMAIADDANRETRIAYPGSAKLAAWADCSEERVPGILQELICRQLIARRSKGRRGRRTEYIVFPTSEEFEQLDALDPTLNNVSPSVIKKVMEQDTKRAEKATKIDAKRAPKDDETASDQPVDNAETRVAPERPYFGVRVARDARKGRTGATPPVSTPVSTTESSTESHHSAAVDNDETPTQHPAPKPHASGRPLDLIAIATAEARWFDRLGLDEHDIETLAAEILDCAATVVLDPTSYVLGSIKRSRPEWEARAFEISVTPAQTEGALF